MADAGPQASLWYDRSRPVIEEYADTSGDVRSVIREPLSSYVHKLFLLFPGMLQDLRLERVHLKSPGSKKTRTSMTRPPPTPCRELDTNGPQ